MVQIVTLPLHPVGPSLPSALAHLPLRQPNPSLLEPRTREREGVVVWVDLSHRDDAVRP